MKNKYSALKNGSIWNSRLCIFERKNILIEGEKLTIVSKAQEIPPEYDVIDLTGKYILPGLFDMHTHYYSEGKNYKRINQHTLYNLLFLSYGVTTIRSMGELYADQTLLVRDRAERGEILAPKIVTSAEYFDGLPSIVEEFNEQSSSIQHMKEKYLRLAPHIDFVKVYENLSPEYIKVLFQLASQDGKKLVAHLGKYDTIDCINSGIRGLEHGMFTVREFLDLSQQWPTEQLMNFTVKGNDKVDKVIECIVKNDVACTPTTIPLTVAHKRTRRLMEEQQLWDYFLQECRDEMKAKITFQWDNPTERMKIKERNIEQEMLYIEKLRKAKVKVFCGTDCISILCCPGASLSLEAEWLGESGYTTREMLQILTINAAYELGLEKSLGSIESGKLANLLVVDENPLQKISNLRKVHCVYKNGELLNPQKLRDEAKILANDNFKD